MIRRKILNFFFKVLAGTKQSLTKYYPSTARAQRVIQTLIQTNNQPHDTLTSGAHTTIAAARALGPAPHEQTKRRWALASPAFPSPTSPRRLQIERARVSSSAPRPPPMAQRSRSRSRARRDPDLDEDGSPPSRQPRPGAGDEDDEDDELGNEDLSLEIVARAQRKQRGASGAGVPGFADLLSVSSGDEEVDEDAVVELAEADEPRRKQKKKKERRKQRKKHRKEATEVAAAAAAVEEEEKEVSLRL